MLSKQDMLDLGYGVHVDPDQIGRWYWNNLVEGSDISFDTEEEAWVSANEDAQKHAPFSRCDNCGKLHAEQTLVEAKDLSERLDPNGPAPSGECPDCGALCYEIEEYPAWETVMGYFGLDPSFMWSAENVVEYTQQYQAAMESTARNKEVIALALAFVKKVAALKQLGERTEDGEIFNPPDGFEDSHHCLMGLIDDARALAV